MPGILPEEVAGGLPYRSLEGDPLHNDLIQNAYSPPATFVASCELTALPTDCTARIEARQINAIVSEMIALAECFDPNGPWSCPSITNLCRAFSQWVTDNIRVLHLNDGPPDPATIKPSEFWYETDTGFLFISYVDGDSTQWVQVAEGNVFADGTSIVGAGTAANKFSVGVIDCGTY